MTAELTTIEVNQHLQALQLGLDGDVSLCERTEDENSQCALTTQGRFLHIVSILWNAFLF